MVVAVNTVPVCCATSFGATTSHPFVVSPDTLAVP